MAEHETAYEMIDGDSPLLISVPHAGHHIPDHIAGRMTDTGRSSLDSDWLVDRLYRFAPGRGHAVIWAHFSRYVIDLNRPADQAPLYPGQIEAGLCPTHSFAGDALYQPGMAPDQDEIDRRIARYWQPYHQALSAALAQRVERFGFALLWDAHSIRSEVPRLFEGQLPALNFGSFDDRSCESDGLAAVLDAVDAARWSCVANQRFRGGYITRHYGQSGGPVRAIQLELSQRTYMDEPELDRLDDMAQVMDQAWSDERADQLSGQLETLLARYLEWGHARFAQDR